MLPKRIKLDLRSMMVLLFQAFRSSLLFLFSIRKTAFNLSSLQQYTV